MVGTLTDDPSMSSQFLDALLAEIDEVRLVSDISAFESSIAATAQAVLVKAVTGVLCDAQPSIMTSP